MSLSPMKAGCRRSGICLVTEWCSDGVRRSTPRLLPNGSAMHDPVRQPGRWKSRWKGRASRLPLLRGIASPAVHRQRERPMLHSADGALQVRQRPRWRGCSIHELRHCPHLLGATVCITAGGVDHPPRHTACAGCCPFCRHRHGLKVNHHG